VKSLAAFYAAGDAFEEKRALILSLLLRNFSNIEGLFLMKYMDGLCWGFLRLRRSSVVLYTFLNLMLSHLHMFSYINGTYSGDFSRPLMMMLIYKTPNYIQK